MQYFVVISSTEHILWFRHHEIFSEMILWDQVSSYKMVSWHLSYQKKNCKNIFCFPVVLHFGFAKDFLRVLSPPHIWFFKTFGGSFLEVRILLPN